jgi:hypothetical protein
MIVANQDTLRELDVLGPYLDLVPVQILDSLTYLGIWGPEGEDALPFIFRHAGRLESLVLTGLSHPQILSLDMNTAILPRLSSLCIATDAASCSQESWRIIGNFIRGRMSLQRLRLCLRSTWSDFHEILPIIKDLPALRILHLSTGNDDDWDLEFLALHIPPTVESLRLWLGTTKNMEPLVTDLRAL